MRLTSTIFAAVVLMTGAAHGADAIAPDDVQFDENGAVATSLTGVPGDPANGAKLMNKGAGNCVACHKIPSLPNLAFQGEIGPPLEYPADVWSEAELRGIVIDAKKTFPDTMMPSFYKTSGFIRPGDGYTGKAAKEIKPILTAQEVEDVVAFLLTLKE